MKLLRKIPALLAVAFVFPSGPASASGDSPGAKPDSSLEGLFALLEQSDDGFSGIPFSEVVRAATGHSVREVDRAIEAKNLAVIAEVIDRAVAEINRGGHAFQAAGRINEASGPVEDEIVRQFQSETGWKVEFAPTADGKVQRAGYPDLRLQAPDGLIYYLDPKLIQAGNRRSSFRTFYYEPRRNTGKINDSAAHLLVGLVHNEKPGPGLRLTSWELVDLARLPVRLKAEFQASNREIYTPESVLDSRDASASSTR